MAIEEILTVNDTPELAFSFRQNSAAENEVRRVNQVRLTTDTSVLLLVMLEPDNGRISVRVRVLPGSETSMLPPNLSLSLLSMTGETLQSVQAREQDNSMQLRRFRCSPGMQFRLQVAIADIATTEDFVS